MQHIFSLRSIEWSLPELRTRNASLDLFFNLTGSYVVAWFFDRQMSRWGKRQMETDINTAQESSIYSFNVKGK